MASEGPRSELRIGDALKEARRRAGLDIRTVEERTKIRTRYLRALEAEEWGALPGHAYVKGFLRTYANLLGLDADALVDEYRRTEEGPQASPVPLGEGVLQARQRLRDPSDFGRGPSRLWILAGVVFLVAAILLVLGLTGDEEGAQGPSKDDEKERQQKQGKGTAKSDRAAGRGGGSGAKQGDKAPQTVAIRLVANADGLQVCLLGDSKQPLIDGFAGSAGSEDSFEAKRFELRFPSGFDLSQFDLFVGGERAKLEELQGPAAFMIEPPRRIRQLDPPGSSCP